MTNQSNWDQHWKNTQKAFQFYEFLQKQQFKCYLELIGNRLNSHSKILEIGAGSGYLTRQLCSRFHCSAQLIDSSSEARRFFGLHNKNPRIRFRQMNAFEFKQENRFDLVFSDGLVEHFTGKKQKKLIFIHAKAAKKNGFLILFVPRKSKRYSLIKKVCELAGIWHFGYERPYTPKQFQKLLSQNGLKPEKTVKGLWEIGAICVKK